MNKLIAGLCCLMLAVSPLALAQGADAGKKSAPPSAKEQAEQKKAIHAQASRCANDAQRNKLKQGSKEFVNFMTQCLSQK